MITIILCETSDELAAVQQRFPGLSAFMAQLEPKKAEWLTAEEFAILMAERGYKAGALVTKKKLCERFGIPFKKKGNSYYFANEVERLPKKN
jgi:hypothetical protein